MICKFPSLTVLLTVISLTGVFAQYHELPIVAKNFCDWNEGRFYLDLACELPKDQETIAPKLRYQVELYMRQRLKEKFLQQLQTFALDSRRTITHSLEIAPEILDSLSGLADRLQFHYSRLNLEGTHLEMRYSVELWKDLAEIFSPIRQTNPLDAPFSWVPTRPFSGLVIFAQGPLPWKNTSLDREWQPALFFRLLNPDGEVLFDVSHMQQSFLKKWGMGAYQENKLNEERYKERIGFDPLRVVAFGLWGTVATDLILPQEACDRLLADPANRQFLAEGRILILWGDPQKKIITNSDSEQADSSAYLIPQPPAGTRIEKSYD